MSIVIIFLGRRDSVAQAIAACAHVRPALHAVYTVLQSALAGRVARSYSSCGPLLTAVYRNKYLYFDASLYLRCGGISQGIQRWLTK